MKIPMTKVNGQVVPSFAADGKGANDMKKKMMYGGMSTKKPKQMMQAGGRVYAPSRKPART